MLFCGSPDIYAQKTTLKGTVHDAKTGQPVSAVGVQFENSGKGTATNEAGSFSLSIDTVLANATLTFSHLSYEPLTLKIKPGQTNYQVKLKPKLNELSEVKITANRKLKPLKIRPETIVDYAITNNLLYVLAWETGQKNPSLQVLNLKTDSVLVTYRFSALLESLFVDCLENLHLLSENKVYQVHFDSGSLRLYPSGAKSEFEQKLRPCVASNSTNLYFRRNINKGIIVSFFTVNQQTQQTKLLRTVQDNVVLGMHQSEKRFQFFRNYVEAEDASKVNSARMARRAANNFAFTSQVMFAAPYVPLLKIGKQICLFDHVNGKLEGYENDSLQRVIPINYHLQKSWAKEITVDAPEQKAYALFQKNGLYELKLLNLGTGETENTYRITNPFATKIRVHQGNVYFLYKDPAKNQRQFLYKAPLSSL